MRANNCNHYMKVHYVRYYAVWEETFNEDIVKFDRLLELVRLPSRDCNLIRQTREASLKGSFSTVDLLIKIPYSVTKVNTISRIKSS
jgi:hypothetical protein